MFILGCVMAVLGDSQQDFNYIVTVTMYWWIEPGECHQQCIDFYHKVA